MALPDHVLSSEVVYGYYLVPDNRDPSPLIDYEYGGVALYDPSQGFWNRIWYAKIKIDGVKELKEILIGSEGVSEVSFFSGESFTEISLAFDQNMNPFLAFTADGISKFYWYDPIVAGYVLTALPAGSRSPKCCLDDKREFQRGTSDILLMYMRGTTLYYREQRDRFEVEYTLKTGLLPGDDVLVVGMTDRNRVQVVVGLQDFPEGEVNYRYTTTGNRRVTVDGSPRRLVRVSYG